MAQDYGTNFRSTWERDLHVQLARVARKMVQTYQSSTSTAKDDEVIAAAGLESITSIFFKFGCGCLFVSLPVALPFFNVVGFVFLIDMLGLTCRDVVPSVEGHVGQST